MAALLELDNVDARYGGVQALRGVSLRVDDGESVAILGANGAGKTSTLRAISGTVRRSGGIVFNGTEIGKPIHDGAVEFIRLEPGTYNVAVFGPKPGAFKLGTQGTSDETPLLEQVLSLAEGERQALALVVQL